MFASPLFRSLDADQCHQCLSVNSSVKILIVIGTSYTGTIIGLKTSLALSIQHVVLAPIKTRESKSSSPRYVIPSQRASLGKQSWVKDRLRWSFRIVISLFFAAFCDRQEIEPCRLICLICAICGESFCFSDVPMSRSPDFPITRCPDHPISLCDLLHIHPRPICLLFH